MQHNFFFSTHVLLLFKEWQVDTTGVLVGAFIGVFLFTFLYEIASFYQSRYANGRVNSKGSQNCDAETTQTSESEEPFRYGTFGSDHAISTPHSENSPINRTIPLHVRVKLAFTPRYILSSVTFPFLLAANYFIMLAVMTYNGWLFIAVCLASGLAYFLLHPDRDIPAPKLPNDGRCNQGQCMLCLHGHTNTILSAGVRLTISTLLINSLTISNQCTDKPIFSLTSSFYRNVLHVCRSWVHGLDYSLINKHHHVTCSVNCKLTC